MSSYTVEEWEHILYLVINNHMLYIQRLAIPVMLVMEGHNQDMRWLFQSC